MTKASPTQATFDAIAETFRHIGDDAAEIEFRIRARPMVPADEALLTQLHELALSLHAQCDDFAQLLTKLKGAYDG